MAPLHIIITLLMCFTMIATGSRDLPNIQDLTHHLTTSSGVRITDSAKAIIDTMSSVAQLPSCNKMASAALINTCSELDVDKALGAGQTVDALLEKSKSIYAARLAICELSDAHAYIPDACSAFTPNERTSWKSYLLPGRRPQHPTYEQDTIETLDRCLKALSSKPQSWTSYSNAKQNAIVMCHAMRASIDKDEKLEIFQMVVELNKETMGAMSEATRDFESFLKDFAVIRKDMESFQMSLNEGATAITERLEKYWASIHGNVRDLDYSIITMLENARQAGQSLDQYRDQSHSVHSDAIKALLSMAAMINETKYSSATSLDLQMEMNKNLLDALNLTISASKSAGSVDALMIDLAQRLNETVLVAENLRNTLFSTETLRAICQYFMSLLLGETSKDSRLVTLFVLISGCFAVRFITWYPHCWVGFTMISFALASGLVQLATSLVTSAYHFLGAFYTGYAEHLRSSSLPSWSSELSWALEFYLAGYFAAALLAGVVWLSLMLTGLVRVPFANTLRAPDFDDLIELVHIDEERAN